MVRNSEHLFSLLCACLLLACGDAEQDDWQRVRSTNTVQSYQEYLQENPQGRFRQEAQLRILLMGADRYIDTVVMLGFAHFCHTNLKFKGDIEAGHFQTAAFAINDLNDCHIQGRVLSFKLIDYIRRSGLQNALIIRQACCSTTGYDDGFVMYFDDAAWYEPVKIGLNKTQLPGASELKHKVYPRIEFKSGVIGIKRGNLYIRAGTLARLDGHIFRYFNAEWRLDSEDKH